MNQGSFAAAASMTEGGFEAVRSVTQRKYVARAAVAAGGTRTLWTPASGKKVQLRTVHVTVDAATQADVRIGTTVIAQFDFAGAGSHAISFGAPGWQGAADETVNVVFSAACNAGGTATGTELT